MTTIRTCYVGEHAVNGLVGNDGSIIALIVDERLVSLLGRPPVSVRLWVRYYFADRIVCVRDNGHDYDIADTPDPDKADEAFRKEPWGGSLAWVSSLKKAGNL